MAARLAPRRVSRYPVARSHSLLLTPRRSSSSAASPPTAPKSLHTPLRTFALHPPSPSLASASASSPSAPNAYAADGEVDPAEADLVPLSPHVFGLPSRPDILYRCIVFERSLFRSGSANSKTRSELSYSGRKLRPQKGLGKARIGSRSSPVLLGGAAAHGPKPKDWSLGLPRKVWEMGLRLVLSERWRDGNLVVVPRFDVDGRGWGDAGSRALEGYAREKGWCDAVYVSGDWDSLASGTSALRTALERPSYIRTQGIRHGQRGTWWLDLQRRHHLPLLNSISLAHPDDFSPGQPHPLNGWKPGKIGVYHLMLHKKVVMDLKGLEMMQDRLTRDLRRPIGALGTEKGEAEAWDLMMETTRNEARAL